MDKQQLKLEQERDWEYRKTKGTVAIFCLLVLFIATIFGDTP